MPLSGPKKPQDQASMMPPPPQPPPMDFSALMRQRFGGMYGSADVNPVWMNGGYMNPRPGLMPPTMGIGTGMGMQMPMAPPLPNQPSMPPMPNAPRENPILGGEKPPLAQPEGVFKQLYRLGHQVGGTAGDMLMNRARPPLPAPAPMMPPPTGQPQGPGYPDPNRTQVPNLPPSPQGPDPRQNQGPQGQRRGPMGGQGGQGGQGPQYGGRIGRRMAERGRPAGPRVTQRRPGY